MDSPRRRNSPPKSVSDSPERALEYYKSRGRDYAYQKLEAAIRTMADEITTPAASKVGMKPKALRRLISVSLFRISEVNGFTKFTKRHRIEVGINAGLLLFLHRFTQLLILRLGIRKEGIVVEEPKHPSWDESVADARILMNAFWDDTLDELPPQSSVTDLRREQLLFAASLLHCAELSVVAHEFGHIIIGLSPSPPSEIAEAMALLHDAQRAGKLSGPGIAVNVIPSNWAKEIACDLIGLQLLLSTEASVEGKMIAYASSVFVLAVMSNLELLGLLHRGDEIRSSTHPPTWVRVMALDAITRQGNSPVALSIADTLRRVLGELLQAA